LLRLLFLFTVVPVVELYLLIQLGKATSAEVVVGLVLLTGAVGAALAKHQGIGLLQRMQADMSEGREPSEGLMDGALILVGGAFLITPGVITDALGFAMLAPWTRHAFKRLVKEWVRRQMAAGSVQVHVGGKRQHEPEADMQYDIDMDEDAQ